MVNYVNFRNLRIATNHNHVINGLITRLANTGNFHKLIENQHGYKHSSTFFNTRVVLCWNRQWVPTQSKPGHYWICICIQEWKVASIHDADVDLGKIATHLAFVMVNFLKSQASTSYFSNSIMFIRNYCSVFHEVPNLNRLFLKLIRFIYN